MNPRILKAIGENLMKAGQCPYNSSCPFGRGSRCVAPPDEVEARQQAIKHRINNTPFCFATEAVMDPSPWPCENIWTVRFVDPTAQDDD